AVIVAADRSIQSANPQLVPMLTNAISSRLAENSEASGYVPGMAILEFQYNNPRWVAMTHSELAEEFGVDRIVFVDVYEYRLHEPGNPYLWAGVAAANVGVVESDGPLPDDYIYSKAISVGFPDGAGFGPTDFNAATVATVLNSRFVDRITWLFYEHQEPYYPDY
ncbi:MAG: hypothetical protein VYC34_12345, partial [Planctomycetota bacterium]|nr:hypothetical protein [Planctomycetota bacterium]